MTLSPDARIRLNTLTHLFDPRKREEGMLNILSDSFFPEAGNSEQALEGLRFLSRHRIFVPEEHPTITPAVFALDLESEPALAEYRQGCRGAPIHRLVDAVLRQSFMDGADSVLLLQRERSLEVLYHLRGQREYSSAMQIPKNLSRPVFFELAIFGQEAARINLLRMLGSMSPHLTNVEVKAYEFSGTNYEMSSLALLLASAPAFPMSRYLTQEFLDGEGPYPSAIVFDYSFKEDEDSSSS